MALESFESIFFHHDLLRSQNSITDAEIVIATTRPETMLGDTGIAVHPHDDRYSHLIGQSAVHPFTGRRVPVIADEAVDMAYGTGQYSHLN